MPQKCTSNEYTDDTSVTCPAGNIDKLYNDLSTEVDNIAEWLGQNELSLNTDKTNVSVLVTKTRITNWIYGPLEVNIDEGPVK